MSNITFVNYLRITQQLSYRCSHGPTYLETYAVDGDLIERKIHDRIPLVEIKHSLGDCNECKRNQNQNHSDGATSFNGNGNLQLTTTKLCPGCRGSGFSSLPTSTAVIQMYQEETLDQVQEQRLRQQEELQHQQSPQSSPSSPLPLYRSLSASSPTSCPTRTSSSIPPPCLSTFCRFTVRATVDELMNAYYFPRVLWEMVLEYSTTVYKLVDNQGHRCEQVTHIGEWTIEMSQDPRCAAAAESGKEQASPQLYLQPSPVFSTYMQTVCSDKLQQALTMGNYQYRCPRTQMWLTQSLLSLTPSRQSLPSTRFSSLSPISHHSSSSSVLYLTRSSIEAYRSYYFPDILHYYSYSRNKKFEFPVVEGVMVELDVQVQVRREMENAVEEALEQHRSINGAVEELNQQMQGCVMATESNNNSNSSDDQLVWVDRFGSFSSNTPSPLSRTHSLLTAGSIPAHLVFEPCWQLGDRCFRTGLPTPNQVDFRGSLEVVGERRSVIGEWLNCDVPVNLCPFLACSKIAFAVTFGIKDAPPQPTVILWK